MASVEKRGEKFRVRYREDGRNKSIGGLPTRRAAQAIADEIDRVHARGQGYKRTRRAPPAFLEAVEAYLTWAASRKAPLTLSSRATHFDRYHAWAHGRRGGQLFLDQVTAESLEAVADALVAEGKSQIYANAVAGSVRLLYRWARGRDDWRDVLPSLGRVELPPAQPAVDPTAPTWAEVDRAIAHAEGYLRELLIVGRYTGLRKMQIMHLRWEDVDLEEATLLIRPNLPGSKSKREKLGRIVPISPHLVEELAGWGRREGFLIDRPSVHHLTGEPLLLPRRVQDRPLRRAWEAAGLPVPQPTHGVRKTHYTELHIAGVPDAHIDHLQGRIPSSLGKSVYLVWKRMEDALRAAVAHIPPIDPAPEVTSLDEARAERHG